ncbi:hypothetical protein GZ77_16910 [Endozoicomonas montiporae]|uniref:Hydrolase n=2 Tax=Endozoicomonas montiporae TaxID=1027273 RepID=A0A081N652_9GAMM|nr:Cof-type HAD-IIB family hydrolase [Endozoicomonas montiporae]AMO57152.1 Cof-like hydrolase [Endozoicomonas montiporae CL-33]KEQ13925.1 hypothetical protein GZ77_16910 [Endozoicomonas montiporae]
MHSVVVSDLDGTLLNSQHKITPYTREVIRRLHDAGIKFVFATGRHHIDVGRLANELGISMYLITANGARVHNPSGQIIIRHDIFPEIVPELIDLGREFQGKVLTNMYQEDSWFIEERHESVDHFSDENKFAYQLQDLDTVNTTGVSKIFYLAEKHEDLLPLEKRIRDELEDSVSMTFSLPNCLEVMAPGVCKGVALAEVLKLKGLDFKNAVAFGDGLNDYEMLQGVDKGLLMGNADKKLRALLPDNEMIGDCNENGVAAFLERHYSH